MTFLFLFSLTDWEWSHSKDNIWTLKDAQSKFSEVVERALTHGTQIVTRRGKKVVAVLPYKEYERLTQLRGRLAQSLLDSPLPGSRIKIERNKGLPRDIEIEQ